MKGERPTTARIDLAALAHNYGEARAPRRGPSGDRGREGRRLRTRRGARGAAAGRGGLRAARGGDRLRGGRAAGGGRARAPAPARRRPRRRRGRRRGRARARPRGPARRPRAAARARRARARVPAVARGRGRYGHGAHGRRARGRRRARRRDRARAGRSRSRACTRTWRAPTRRIWPPPAASSRCSARCSRACARAGSRRRACTSRTRRRCWRRSELADAIPRDVNAVRPGLMLYGVQPSAERAGVADLRPVMSLRTRVANVRHVRRGEPVGYGATFRAKQRGRIATLPIGYADGVPWALGNRGHVLLRGRKLRIAGRVSMDLLDARRGRAAGRDRRPGAGVRGGGGRAAPRRGPRRGGRHHPLRAARARGPPRPARARRRGVSATPVAC